MPVTNYKLILGSTTTIAQQVEENLKSGWELWGLPTADPNRPNQWLQALIRTDEYSGGKKRIAYLEGKTIAEITMKVEESLEEGWAVVAGLTVAELKDGLRFYQMMEKRFKENPTKE